MNCSGIQENVSSNLRSQQNRKLAYRELLSRTEKLDEAGDMGLETAQEIGDILQQANALNEEVRIEDRVQNADETLLDFKVISSASEIMKKCIHSVDVFTATYEPAEFALKLTQYMNEESEEPDLCTLMSLARLIVPEVPLERHLYGAYDLANVPQPKQKERSQRAPTEKMARKAPEKVVSVDQEEAHIQKIVESMNSVLNEAYKCNHQRPINYYDYIIDTESYATTIENMFYFGFLIRDGKASLDLVDLVPMIKPMKKHQAEAHRANGGQNSQIISSINMDTWEKFTKEGLLQKHRISSNN
ncbi:non-structural maintenance of chromosomes element 4 homolog A [Dendroctonus ponderosae]|uniref:non-structural maintenance of chromosomes element 4 homolog A n=1 Tax=Dendroctonus ponderosae TaxID=77166 RepID=UPI0020356ACE|nr:non-structural maintenance of chromosomes element 4 homolog A [Dendroctonus ponderosae]KAH1028201.1 hypothetical protein HUJ05_001576 [Dendroctonus ponderosae]